MGLLREMLSYFISSRIDCVITKTKVRGEVNSIQREGKDTKDRIEDTEQKKEIEIVLNTEKLVEN